MTSKTIKENEGRIHSVQSFGTLDGPGIRYVVFMQGCPLNCVFCHNADLIDSNGGKKISLDCLIEKIDKCVPYLKQGGITVSGGEPTLQYQFVKGFLSLCKQRGLHTALDTCLYTNRGVLDLLIPEVDLFLVSVKHLDNDKHMELTGKGNEQIFENIKYVASKKPLWLRYVLIEGKTDSEKDLRGLIDFAAGLEKLELIELLQYNSIGSEKNSSKQSFRAPESEKIIWAKKLLEKNGFKVLV